MLSRKHSLKSRDASSERGLGVGMGGGAGAILSPVSSESSGVGSKQSSIDNLCFINDCESSAGGRSSR